MNTPKPNAAPAEVRPTKGELRAALIDNDNVLRDIRMRIQATDADFRDYILSQMERVTKRNHDLLCDCAGRKAIQHTINVPALVAGPPIAIESTSYRDGDGNRVDEFARWTEPEPAKDLPVTLRLSVEGAEILRQAVSAYCSGDPSQQPAHGDLPRLKALLMMLPESTAR